MSEKKLARFVYMGEETEADTHDGIICPWCKEPWDSDEFDMEFDDPFQKCGCGQEFVIWDGMDGFLTRKVVWAEPPKASVH